MNLKTKNGLGQKSWRRSANEQKKLNEISHDESHLRLLPNPVLEARMTQEENKVNRQMNLKVITERWRQTYLRWMSLILIEPCMIRWVSPSRYQERHEFENIELRAALGPGRRW